MTPVKATLLDDDGFRLLAIPFGGPIPSPHSPRGVDVDGEWFSERTDIKPDWLKARAVDWHHGKDPYGMMNPARYAGMAQPPAESREVIGKAVDPVMDEDGWWVTVWLDHGARRLGLVKQLAERGAQLFGSSETVAGLQAKASTGEILRWPYWRQTLSTSPQNTHSVLRPLKAALDDALTDFPSTTPAFWRDITGDLRDLAADLRRTSAMPGDDAAKAGRVLSAVNQQDIEAAVRAFEEATGVALERLRGVLARAASAAPKGDEP